MAVNSVVGLAYYLRVITAMYMTPAPAVLTPVPTPSRTTSFIAGLCALLVLWLGFGPTLFGIGAESLLALVHRVAG